MFRWTGYGLVLTYCLLVGCGGGGSSSSPPPIKPDNTLPLSDAGNYQHVKVGDVVYLDGSASFDADGDLISYAWTVLQTPAGSSAELSDATSAKPSFTADYAGVYVIQLIVHDGTDSSLAVTTQITAEVENSKPVAHAGSDLTNHPNVSVPLDGSASSDADGDLLSYTWVQTGGPNTASLTNANTVSPTFIATEVGEYTIRLVVDDGEVDSDPAYVVVSVVEENIKPTADAGQDAHVVEGDVVTLDGSDSFDPNADSITYQWAFVSKPSGSNATLSNATAVSPSFTADVVGTYVLALVVSDGKLDSDEDRVTITASELNVRPVANAGGNQNVFTGMPVVLDGSASSDANNDDLTYTWRFVSIPSSSNTSLVNDSQSIAEFTPDVDGAYVVELKVSDGELTSDPVTVTITAETENSAPVANAGNDQTGYTGQVVTLDGSNSYDPDGDLLQYTWSVVSQPAGSSSSLSDTATASPSFTPDVAGDYVFSLIVSDGDATSTSDNVVVTVEEPSLKLELYKPETPFDPAHWQAVNLPHSANSSINQTITGTIPPTYTLAEYRLTAEGRDYTLHNVQVNPVGGSLNPRFTGLSSGQVVEAGQSVTFSLDVDYVDVTAVTVQVTFNVIETDSLFQAKYVLTFR